MDAMMKMDAYRAQICLGIIRDRAKQEESFHTADALGEAADIIRDLLKEAERLQKTVERLLAEKEDLKTEIAQIKTCGKAVSQVIHMDENLMADIIRKLSDDDEDDEDDDEE